MAPLRARVRREGTGTSGGGTGRTSIRVNELSSDNGASRLAIDHPCTRRHSSIMAYFAALQRYAIGLSASTARAAASHTSTIPIEYISSASTRDELRANFQAIAFTVSEHERINAASGEPSVLEWYCMIVTSSNFLAPPWLSVRDSIRAKLCKPLKTNLAHRPYVNILW